MDNKNNTTVSSERYRVYIASHKGLVRDNNEDNFTVNNVCKKLEIKNVKFVSEHDAPLLTAVFDGMGGESKGEYASLISAKAAKQLYENIIQTPDPETRLEELVTAFVQNANNEIRAFLEENKCQTGGSTIVALVFIKGVAYPFSLGDSRIYLLRDGVISQISKDQTLAQKKYEANIYTLEEAEKSVDSHKLTSFLGVDYYRQGLAPQLFERIVLQEGDKLLLYATLVLKIPKTRLSSLFRRLSITAATTTLPARLLSVCDKSIKSKGGLFMDFSFLSKMGFSMDDIGKIAEIVMSGGDEDKIADELNAKFGIDKSQAKDIIKQGKGFIGNIPNPFAKK